MVISGTEQYYARLWNGNNSTLYVVAGSTSAEGTNQAIKEKENIYYANGPSYGVLTFWNNSAANYQQKTVDGSVIDSLDFVLPGQEKSKDDSRKKEKLIAVIVLVCSLVFLCYFIYSWVSCYLKKPRIAREGERLEVPQREEYAMQSIHANV